MFGGAALCSQCWHLVGIWIPHSATLRMIPMAFPGHPIQNAPTPSCILFWIPVRVLKAIYNNQLINIFSLVQFVSLIRIWESQGLVCAPVIRCNALVSCTRGRCSRCHKVSELISAALTAWEAQSRGDKRSSSSPLRGQGQKPKFKSKLA